MLDLFNPNVTPRDYVDGVDIETLHQNLDDVIGFVSPTRVHRANVARGFMLTTGLVIGGVIGGHANDVNHQAEYDAEFVQESAELAIDRANTAASLADAEAKDADAEAWFSGWDDCLELVRRKADEERAAGYFDQDQITLEVAVDNEETGVCGTATDLSSLWDSVISVTYYDDLLVNRLEEARAIKEVTVRSRMDDDIVGAATGLSGHEVLFVPFAMGFYGLLISRALARTPHGIRSRKLQHHLKGELEFRKPYDRWRGLDNKKVRDDVNAVLKRYEFDHPTIR